MENHTNPHPSILITGASGFLGKAMVREILGPDSPLKPSLVRLYDIRPYEGALAGCVEQVTADIRDSERLSEACRGIDLVIHSAAIVDWGTYPESEIYSVNTGGTFGVIYACKAAGVRHMVFTSSLDAVYSGKPLRNVDESLPYPVRHSTSYCRSKHFAEKLVKEAAGDGLSTVILRPSDIYGEADPYHMGSLINMAKGGFYVRLGNGKAMCQHVYAGNIAHAHLLAARALLDGNPAVNGNVYFITDGKPSNFFRFFDRIVEGAGYRIWPRNFWIPRPIAYAMGAANEGMAFLLRPVKKYQPRFSRFAVTYTCTDYTFNSEKAKKDFGYEPKYGEEEALRRTTEFFRRPFPGSPSF